jgi:hypothetical protein
MLYPVELRAQIAETVGAMGLAPGLEAAGHYAMPRPGARLRNSLEYRGFNDDFKGEL